MVFFHVCSIAQEIFESSTAVIKDKMVTSMNQFMFINHMTNVVGKPPVKAKTMWDALEKSNAKREVKGGEPWFNVVEKDYTLFRSQKSRSNQVHGSLKEQKNPKQGNVDALMENLDGRALGHDQSFFAGFSGIDAADVEGLDLQGAKHSADMVTGAAAPGRGVKRGAEGTLDGTPSKVKKEPGSDDEVGDSGVKAMVHKESKLTNTRLALQDAVSDAEKKGSELYQEKLKCLDVLSVEEMASPDYNTLVARVRVHSASLGMLLGKTTPVEGVRAALGLTSGDALPATVGEEIQKHSDKSGREQFAACCKLLKLPKACDELVSCSTYDDLRSAADMVGEDALTVPDLRKAKAEFLKLVAMAGEIAKAAKQAASDVKSRKTMKDKRAVAVVNQKEQEKERAQMTQAKAVAAKEKVQAKKNGKANRDSVVAEVVSADSRKEWGMHGLSFPGHPEICRVKVADFDAKKTDYDIPFIVEGVSIDFLKSNASASAIVDVWKKGFDHAPPVLKSGRSQWTLEEQGGPLRDALKIFTPAAKLAFEGEKASVAPFNKSLATVQVFGNAAGSRRSATEMHSIGSLRLSEEGQRDVVIVHLGGMMKFCVSEANPKVEKPTLATISAELKDMTETKVQQLRACGVMLFHATIKPLDLLYQPCGYWLIEKVAPESRNFGIRTSVLMEAKPKSQALLGFDALTEMTKNLPTQDEATSKFLAMCRATMVKP